MTYNESNSYQSADTSSFTGYEGRSFFPEPNREVGIRAMDLLKLHELTTRLRTSADLSPLLHEILAAVTQLHGTNMGTIMLYDSDKAELYLVASQGLPESHVKMFERIPIGTGPCGIAVKTRRRVVVEDVATDERADRVRAAGGLALYQSLYSSPLVTHSGKVIGSLANFFKGNYRPSLSEMVLVDLYARHAAEFIDNARLAEEAERAKKALQHKAQELEHFVHSVAHDLKEPLRTISTFTELLRRNSDSLDPSSQELMKFVADGAGRMTELINDLVAYARLEKETLTLAPVDTTALVHTVVSYLQTTIGETQAEITVGDLPTILAEEKQLAVVFQNLISNAIKFHKKGTRPKVHISAETTAEGWRFSIKDNGIGIEAEHQPSLFRIFHRLNRVSDYPGSGIGLASCRKIIDRHHGRIWVDSTPGEGSAFHFVLATLKDGE